jgi:hypothetical protein
LENILFPDQRYTAIQQDSGFGHAVHCGRSGRKTRLHLAGSVHDRKEANWPWGYRSIEQKQQGAGDTRESAAILRISQLINGITKGV